MTSAWPIRLFLSAVRRLRPYLGWVVLLICLLLAMMPALAVDAHEWIRVRRIQTGLTLAGPLAVLTFWLLAGWKRPAGQPRRAVPVGVVDRFVSLLRFLGALYCFSAIGLLVLEPALSALAAGYQSTLWQTLHERRLVGLPHRVRPNFCSFFDRYAIWWQGIQGGGAVQDDLVFAGMAGPDVLVPGPVDRVDGPTRNVWSGRRPCPCSG